MGRRRWKHKMAALEALQKGLEVQPRSGICCLDLYGRQGIAPSRYAQPSLTGLQEQL